MTALPAVAFATAGSASAMAGAPAASTVSAPVAWTCIASDNGAANPGPACPGNNSHGYSYKQITNSNGYTTFVNNDMWNPPGQGHPQTIYVNDPGNWKVVSDQAKGNTSVLSYPSVQQVFTLSTDKPAPISTFQTLLSDYAESMPSGGDNEAAYDIWLGTSPATAYSQEVMIWVDNHRTNPPPGKLFARPQFFGTQFTVYKDASTSPATVYFVRNQNATSSQVHIISMLKWLETARLSPAGSGINDIEFGWEICSTNSQPWTFTVSKYDLVSECAKKGTSCWSA
ncbi:MAG TPA: hypothetical protein VH478_24045 [Trebonia sp.]|nr:hypothetical protein [Trebonia sp.]